MQFLLQTGAEGAFILRTRRDGEGSKTAAD